MGGFVTPCADDCPAYEPAPPAAVVSEPLTALGLQLPGIVHEALLEMAALPVAAVAEPATATRICAECGQEKPLTEFGKNLARGNVGGHQLFCRACGKRHRVEGLRRAKAARQSPAPVMPHKACTRCDESKPLPEFGPYDGTLDKLDFLCADCRALATAERAQRATAKQRGGATRAAAAEGA